ncbi:sialidase family protein [soil metagenome]
MNLLHSVPRMKPSMMNTIAAACIGAGVMVLAAASAAAAPPRPVSGIDPLAGCFADRVASQPGINYPDSEIEPTIDDNPKRPANLIAVWQQDRWSDGGARGLVAGVSIDSGVTWSRLAPPGITKCSGGIYDRASDPWVTFSPNGTAYFLSLAFNNNRPDGGGGQNAVLVNRSLNGGFQWSRPISLIVDTDGQIFNDKESMTADPKDSRFAYAVWDRLQDFTLPAGKQSGPAARSLAKRLHDGVVNARQRHARLEKRARMKAPASPPTFKGPSVFVRTTNGGASWEPPKIIYDPGNDAQTINNIVEVLPDGTLVNFFTNISSLGETSIGLQKSTNKGRSFKPATLPVTTNVTLHATLSPDDREGVRDANILFDPAVDPENGNLYLVWQDGRFGGIDRVVFSMSTDQGVTWSDPALIAMTPPGAIRLRNQSFIPSVEVGANHQIVVTYYDFRNDLSNGQERTDYFAVFCTPSASVDCSQRSSWGDGVTPLKDIRLTRQSFDILDAPDAGGHFLGDYAGLVRRGQTVLPAFVIPDSQNKTTVYTTPIRARNAVIGLE